MARARPEAVAPSSSASAVAAADKNRMSSPAASRMPPNTIVNRIVPSYMPTSTSLTFDLPVPSKSSVPFNAFNASLSERFMHGQLSITLPITLLTLTAATILISLAVLGGVYLRKLIKQHKCNCPLCTGEYTIEEQIGSGGFGKVYAVRAKQSRETALHTMRKSSMGFLRLFAWPFRQTTAAEQASDGRSPQVSGCEKDVNGAGGDADHHKQHHFRHKKDKSGGSDASSGDSEDEVHSDRRSAATPQLAVVGGLTYVLKMVPVTDINDATEAQREARDLRYLKHPRIVRYVDDFLHSTPSGATKDGSLYVCIIMERCKDDMRRFIQLWRRKSQPIPEITIVRWAAQLISALKYCHARNICHRDVKSQNIFLSTPATALRSTAKAGDHLMDDVKLGDFGLARSFDRPFTAYTEAGTDVYKSPEAFIGGKRDGRKADIWALGLVLAELVTKQYTWERPGSLGAQVLHKEAGALEKVLALLPETYSPSLRLLIKKCLLPNPDERPAAEELFRFKILRQAIANKAGSAVPTVTALQNPQSHHSHASHQTLRQTKSDVHAVVRRSQKPAGAADKIGELVVNTLAAAPKPTAAARAVTGGQQQEKCATPTKAVRLPQNIPLPSVPETSAGIDTTPKTVELKQKAALLATPMSVVSGISERDALTDLDLMSDGPGPLRLRANLSDGGEADEESEAVSPDWQRVEYRKQARRRRHQVTTTAQ